MKELANQVQAYLQQLNPSVGPIVKLKTTDSPDLLNIILFSGGGPPDGEYGRAGTVWLSPTLILRTRGIKDSEQEPLDRMMRIFDHTIRLQAVDLADPSTGKVCFWEMVRPDQMPFIYERDTLGRTVYTSNWSTRVRW